MTTPSTPIRRLVLSSVKLSCLSTKTTATRLPGSPNGIGRFADDALAFADGEDAAGGDVLDHVYAPTGPPDLETRRPLRRAEPEMDRQVALGEIAGVGLDVADEPPIADRERQLGADAVASGLPHSGF